MKRLLPWCLLLPLWGANGLARADSIAPDIDVIFGAFTPHRQPDGNSVIFSAADGLIVMDTGRHAEHTQQILDWAAAAHRPVKAIINSHWHLDHIGGNARIRAAYPDVRIYASGALGGALQGFLAGYRQDLQQAIAKDPNDSQVPAWRDELALIASAPQSVADEPVTQSGARVIAGRNLVLHLETHAVTAGDVWVFDPTRRVLAAGDLVTLPVPFLDTACPLGWQTALDHLARTNFKTLIPGHGPPLSREQFATYRRAYRQLLICAAGKAPGSECDDGWLRDAGALIAEADRKFARSVLDYYVENSLRASPEAIGRLCGNPTGDPSSSHS